jgi:predicted nucleotidyltransferase
MCTKNQLNDILGQMLVIYHDIYGDAVIGVFLYGSYARGDYEQDSDIDIVAIVKGERRVLQDKLRLIWELSTDIGLEYDTVVSPTVISYDEFEAYKEILPYYRNIAKEGLQVG